MVDTRLYQLSHEQITKGKRFRPGKVLWMIWHTNLQYQLEHLLVSGFLHVHNASRQLSCWHGTGSEPGLSGFHYLCTVEHGIGATALPRVDSLSFLIDIFIGTVDMEFGMVLIYKEGLNKSRLVSCILHKSRAGNQYKVAKMW
jgi:hypothetical protein